MSIDTEFEKFAEEIKEACGKDRWIDWTYEKVGDVERSTLKTNRYSVQTVFIVGLILGLILGIFWGIGIYQLVLLWL